MRHPKPDCSSTPESLSNGQSSADRPVPVVRGDASMHKEMLQCLRRLPNSFQLLETVSRIVSAYNSDTDPWVIGYSGGKDSTAVVKLVFQSLLRVDDPQKAVTVIYCDTGVEIPMA